MFFGFNSSLQDFLKWDAVNWSQALTFWKNKTSVDLPKAKLLEIGSTGGLSIWACQLVKSVDCTNLDNTNELTSELIKKYSPQNIHVYDLNALAFDVENKYDIIITKSILGTFNHEQQTKVISNIHRALKPGGEYWFVENLEGTTIHKFCRKFFVKWGNRWDYWSLKNIPQKLSQFSDIKFSTMGFLGTFGRTEAQRNVLGTLDKYLLDKLTPPDWKYIVSGIAKK